jgi:hypothetical protein
MANNDKNILIVPNIGSTTNDPIITFSGASSTLGPQNISIIAYPTSNGTLSFEGSAGQLFSITNDLTGTIFSVNDVSGIPSIEVLATGEIKLAQFGGNVTVGSTVTATSFLGDGSQLTGVAAAQAGAIYEGDAVITTSYTIATGKNGMSPGPVTIADGVTITVPVGSVWTIV